ncbi:cytochrome P450 [Lenzites betulinus]|nr:cytochrome P450 [Lenzites betulinus]
MAFMENLTLPQAALVAVSLYVAWRLVRPFVVKSTIKNIPGPPSQSLFSGNVSQCMGRHSAVWRRELTAKYGRTSAIYGLLNKPWLFTSDPKAFQHIFSKDQESYEEPNLSMRILLGPGLLGTIGEQHRRQRKMLNPVFSIKNLRNMTPLFYDIIHKGVLGYSFDPLVEDVPDDFVMSLKAFFPEMAKSAAPRVLLPYLVRIGTAAFRRRVLDYLPSTNIRRMKEVSYILYARSEVIFNEKKEALARGDDAVKHQVGEGRDVMSILLKRNMLASDGDKLPDDELLGQVSTLILAGMDTTANALARILYLLAENLDVQERLRAEIFAAVEAEGDGDTLEYDRLMALPYLDAVCRETLRSVVRDTVLPLATPVRGRNGELITAVPLQKDTRIVVDILSCNLDPALWGPDASEWRPERWLSGSVPKEVEEAHLPAVMTFLAGGRSCMLFSYTHRISAETVLFIMLQYFKFENTGVSIAWNSAAAEYPTVGRESALPALPMKVSRIRR